MLTVELVPCWIIQGCNQLPNKELVTLSVTESTSVCSLSPPIKMWIVWTEHASPLHSTFCIWMTGNSQLLTETSLSLLGLQATIPLNTNYYVLFVIFASFRQTRFTEDIRMNHYPDAWERELSQDQRWAHIKERKEDYTSRWGENPAVRCLHFHIVIHLSEPSKDFYEGVRRLIRIAVNNNPILPLILKPDNCSNPCFSFICSLSHSPTHSLIFLPLLPRTYLHVLNVCSWALYRFTAYKPQCACGWKFDTVICLSLSSWTWMYQGNNRHVLGNSNV